MTTGTGIAVAGVWVMVGMAFCGRTVTHNGVVTAILIASLVTWLLV